jgi:hypothetical protein
MQSIGDVVVGDGVGGFLNDEYVVFSMGIN